MAANSLPGLATTLATQAGSIVGGLSRSAPSLGYACCLVPHTPGRTSPCTLHTNYLYTSRMVVRHVVSTLRKPWYADHLASGRPVGIH
jgi:hypothetical protein